jgi:hypothetical protein
MRGPFSAPYSFCTLYLAPGKKPGSIARPNKPSWFPQRSCFRCRIGGRFRYFPRTIARHARPLRDGIPKAAWDHLDELLRLRDAQESSSTDPTVFGLVQLFLQWSEAEAAAGRIVAKQFQNHSSHLSLFLAHSGLGGTLARSVSADAMDDFFETLRSLRLERTGSIPSEHYVHNVGTTVRAMMRWASRPVKGRNPSRLDQPNPLDGYRFPGHPGAVRGQVIRRFLRWTWARARELVGLKRRFDRIFILMLGFQRLTGCRPGESCELEWSEISPTPPPRGDGHRPRWEPTTITIKPEKVKTRKLTNRARKIYVTPPVARLLRALESLDGRNDRFVFPHVLGRGAEEWGYVDPQVGEPWPTIDRTHC